VTEVRFCKFIQTGGYTTANYVWDLLQSRNITPSLPAVEAYHKGLKVSFSFLNLCFSSQYTCFASEAFMNPVYIHTDLKLFEHWNHFTKLSAISIKHHCMSVFPNHKTRPMSLVHDSNSVMWFLVFSNTGTRNSCWRSTASPCYPCFGQPERPIRTQKKHPVTQKWCSCLWVNASRNVFVRHLDAKLCLHSRKPNDSIRMTPWTVRHMKELAGVEANDQK
jgi:hypothetical protein